MQSRVQFFCVGLLGMALALSSTHPLYAADLGKLFIRVATPEEIGSGFASAGLSDSVKDLKSRHGDFKLVDDEASADYLLVVVKRDGLEGKRQIVARLSFKEGDQWKPGAEVTNSGGYMGGGASWGNAARGVIGEASKWVKENRRK